MAILNYTSKEITVKIVYYGPGLSGKTTNIKYIASRIPEDKRGKIITLQTEEDRTLFFDFLPFTVATANGYKLRLQLYTVPGQVFYESTRKLVLQGADGVVFVADSQKQVLEANIESYLSMKSNLKENGIDYRKVPLVFQYNKRDLPNILPVEVLNQKLNELKVPYFESIAIQGKGVLETLFKIVELTVNDLKSKYKLLDTISTSEVLDNIKELVGELEEEVEAAEEVDFELDLGELSEELDLSEELEEMPEETPHEEKTSPEAEPLPEVEFEIEEVAPEPVKKERKAPEKEVPQKEEGVENQEEKKVIEISMPHEQVKKESITLPIEIKIKPGQTLELNLTIKFKVKEE